MKIVIVGATGTLGKVVTEDLEKDHEIIKVGSSSGDIQADITSSEAITNMYKEIGSFDALVSTTGSGHFGPLNEMTKDNFMLGLTNKLMGQVNLVLIGQKYANPGASFSLVSGILSDHPVDGSSNVAAVNAAINGFVKGAALELKNEMRINAISPGVVENSPQLHSAFPGYKPVKMIDVVYAFRKSVLGKVNGEVIKCW